MPSPTPRFIEGDVHHDRVEPLPNYRRLEPAECAILQGFPPDYKWLGSKTAIYKQIGNAVAVQCAQSLARALIEPTTGTFTRSPATQD